jgi:quinol monooxygenase YgiN
VAAHGLTGNVRIYQGIHRKNSKEDMPYVLIIHEVEDYSEWKIIFDNAAQNRKEAGEISYQLLKFDNDANHIVHFSRWSSLQNAKNFFESEQLVKIRKQAGVKAPTFVYLNEIENGIP